ncbi:MAG: hypothetical protein FWH07_06445 [Oscillospiraceae bacterium]|nr:hypothetical protein [Oscillospiraceae bacterium]
MKNFGLIVLIALAVLGGLTLAVMLIRKRRLGSLVDFDDFDTAVSDEEFEHFFGVDQGVSRNLGGAEENEG